MTQLRNFVFTINHPQVADYDSLFSLEAQYTIIGEEVGSTGTQHLQGYVELTKRLTFSKLKKMLPRAHIESRKGTQEQAINYCKKDGLYHEFGTARQSGMRTDLVTLRELIGKGDSLRSIIFNREVNLNAQTIKTAEKLFKYFEPARDYKPTVLWFYGKTGSGKTRTAFELMPEAYFNSLSTGKWWNGYDGHEDIIIDDIREDTFPFKLLLSILDRYPCQVEDKGTIRQFRGRRIIITSPEPPREMYKNVLEDRSQLERRIDFITEVDTTSPFYDDLYYACAGILSPFNIEDTNFELDPNIYQKDGVV